MPRTRTYGLDVDTIAFAARVKAGSGKSLLPDSLKQINKFVVGLKRLSLWNNLIDCYIFRKNYHTIGAVTVGSKIYALKDSINDLTATGSQISTLNINVDDVSSVNSSFNNPAFNLVASNTCRLFRSFMFIGDCRSTSPRLNRPIDFQDGTTTGSRILFTTPASWSTTYGGIRGGFSPTVTQAYDKYACFAGYLGDTVAETKIGINGVSVAVTNNGYASQSATLLTNTTYSSNALCGGSCTTSIMLFFNNDITGNGALYKLIKQTIGNGLNLK